MKPVRLALLPLIGVAAACADAAPQSDAGARTFLIGPSADPDRISITIPEAFLERDSDLRDFVSSRPALIVDLSTFAPAQNNRRGDRATAYLRVHWIREGSVARRTDGSWLNSYSVYNEPGGEAFGLERRFYAHRRFGDRSFLLVGAQPARTMIECVQRVPHVAMTCDMASEYEKGLLIELSFDPAHLPRWRELQARAEAFVRPMIRFGEQTALQEPRPGRGVRLP